MKIINDPIKLGTMFLVFFSVLLISEQFAVERSLLDSLLNWLVFLPGLLIFTVIFIRNFFYFFNSSKYYMLLTILPLILLFIFYFFRIKNVVTLWDI